MGKIRHMDKDWWRPIYRYPLGNNFVYLVCSLIATAMGVTAFLVVYWFSGGSFPAAIAAWCIIGTLGGVAGHVVARHLFFVTPHVRQRGAFLSATVAASSFPGSWMLWTSNDAPGIIIGSVLLSIPAACLIVAIVSCKWISLYTDGVVLGNIVIKYADMVYTEFATGKPYTAHLPELAKGKTLVLISPIDYEYVERDFGVSHYYSFIVTRDTAYVVQSLTGRSDFAANVRNAWSCHDWEKRQKAKQECKE